MEPECARFCTSAPYVIGFASGGMSTDVYVSGGMGSGYIQPKIVANIGMDGGGFSIFDYFSGPDSYYYSGWMEPIPVVFDQPYTFGLNLSAKYSAYDGLFHR